MIILDPDFESQHTSQLIFLPLYEVWKVVTSDTFVEQTFSSDR